MSAPSIEYVTTCRKCPKAFRTEQFVPIIGQPDARLWRFVEGLKKHIEGAHPDVGDEIGMFSAFLIASAYQLTDPYLVEMKETLRHTLHRSTRKHHLTDEVIDLKIAELGFDPEDSRNLRTLLRDFRDLLCEEGQYGPRPPAQT